MSFRSTAFIYPIRKVIDRGIEGYNEENNQGQFPVIGEHESEGEYNNEKLTACWPMPHW